jgi:hypothetical protein
MTAEEMILILTGVALEGGYAKENLFEIFIE